MPMDIVMASKTKSKAGAKRHSVNGNGEARYGGPKTCEITNWDEYFLHLAVATSLKSKDRRCQVGAVIVSQDNVVLSTGFNGFARGVYDDRETYENCDEKLKLICHAEGNAVFNAARMGISVKGSTIYVTKFPCLACCNIIVQTGLERIYTHDEWYWDDDPIDGKEETNHKYKRRVLKEAPIRVDAPYHPHFNPKREVDDWSAFRMLKRDAVDQRNGPGLRN